MMDIPEDIFPKLNVDSVVGASIDVYMELPQTPFDGGEKLTTFYPWDAAERIIGRLDTDVTKDLYQELIDTGRFEIDLLLAQEAADDDAEINQYSSLSLQIGQLMMLDPEVDARLDSNCKMLKIANELEF